MTTPEKDPAEEFAGAPVADPWDEPQEGPETLSEREPEPEPEENDG